MDLQPGLPTFAGAQRETFRYKRQGKDQRVPDEWYKKYLQNDLNFDIIESFDAMMNAAGFKGQF